MGLSNGMIISGYLIKLFHKSKTIYNISHISSPTTGSVSKEIKSTPDKKVNTCIYFSISCNKKFMKKISCP